MKNLFIVFLVIFMCSSVAGQKHNRIDSLNRLSVEDNLNTEVLMEIIEYYKTENIDSLNVFINRFLSLEEVKNDDNIKTQLALIRVNAYLTFNETEEAEKVLNEIPYGNESSPELQIKHNIAKGRILKSKRQFNESLIAFYGALRSVQEHNLNTLLPELYVDIAYVLSQNNDLENSTKYYRYALFEAKKNDNVELQIDIYYALCRVFNGGITVNLDSSVHYGELGVELAKRANYEHGYAIMINIVAAPLIRKGYFRKGLEMSREALMYADKYKFSLKTMYYLTLNQGFAFEKLALYDSALLLMQEAAKLRPEGIDHYRLEYLIYKGQKRYDLALDAFEVYQNKRDSVIMSRNENKLSSLQARHEANLKEREVSELTKMAELQSLQLNQQKYFLIALAILLIFVMAAVVLVYRQRKLKQEQSLTKVELEETQKRLEIEKQYREAELKALRSQMNPHFVFNALNSIQEYIMLNEKKLAGKYLGKFADLMRIYLQHSQEKSIPIREEIEALKLYLELEKLRFEELLVYKITFSENVDLDDVNIPTFLVQPYVENSLKHGLLHKKGDRKLSITFSKKGKMIECEILDNGVGRKASSDINKLRNSDHKSFATTATKNRLDLLNHNKDLPIGETVVDLYDNANRSIGTKVVLSIPISELAI